MKTSVLALAIAGVVLAGCGGGAGSPAAKTSKRGHATLKVLWPERGRLIPLSSNSLVVTLSKNGSNVDTKTIARPTSGQSSTQTDFGNLDVATYDVAIKAYPTTDGSGTAQATGAGTLNAATDSSGTVTLSLASTVSTISVSVASSSIATGATTTLTASAKDASNNLVLLTAGGGTENIVWSSDATGVATVSGSGLTATVTGVSAGTANLSASFTVDDAGTVKTGSAPLTVSAPVVGLNPNPVWTNNFGGTISGDLEVGLDSVVYCIWNYGRIRATNTDGTDRWAAGSGSSTYGLLMAADGNTLFTGFAASNANGSAYALNTDGSTRWATNIGTGGVVSGDIIQDSNGYIYFGDNSDKLVSMTSTGTVRWSVSSGSRVYTRPTVGTNGNIYYGNYGGSLIAVNPSGVTQWTFPMGGSVYSTPTVGSDGTIYIGSGTGKLYAINPNGSQKWVCNLSGLIAGAPLLGPDGTVYIGSNSNKLWAVSSTGTVQWTFNANGPVYSPPVLTSNALYLTSYDGSVYNLALDGTQRWIYSTAGSNIRSAPIMAPNGTLYVATTNGKILAFR